MGRSLDAGCSPGGLWYIQGVSKGRRTYSDAELEAILRRALEQQAAAGDGFGHDELVAAAREVGLDEAAVERAVAEVAIERDTQQIRAALRSKRVQRWLRHLVTYLAVVGGFMGLHLLGLAGAWVLWMAVGWGIGLALDTYGKLRAPTEEEVDAERERLNRQARRQAKAEARREARRRQLEERAQRAARRQQRPELEQVIEEGVSLLLAVAARKIREASGQLEREPMGGERPPDTEFGRYVARQRGQGAEPRGVPQVRVDVSEPAQAAEELEAERARRERPRSRR